MNQSVYTETLQPIALSERSLQHFQRRAGTGPISTVLQHLRLVGAQPMGYLEGPIPHTIHGTGVFT